MTEALEAGGATVAPPDTFTRVRASCSGAWYIDLDKHAAMITEVVARARGRAETEFTGRDEVPAP